MTGVFRAQGRGTLGRSTDSNHVFLCENQIMGACFCGYVYPAFSRLLDLVNSFGTADVNDMDAATRLAR